MSPFILLPCLLLTAVGATRLRQGHYSKIRTCPEAEIPVRNVLGQAMARETRNAASVMRLQFHDCLVTGCDGLVLLDDTPTMLGEKLDLSNINSLRSFLRGGPNWEVKLGRQDSLIASQEASNDIIPSSRANASALITLFERFNLSVAPILMQ